MNKVENQLSPQVANVSSPPRTLPRRTFLCRMGAGAIALAPGAALFGSASRVFGEQDEGDNNDPITKGDAALLRFAAAAEILETDFWVQYNELGGIQDSEEPSGTGNPAYTEALKMLDEDMDVYIHDNTEDERTHFTFLNAYLVSKGAQPVHLNQFRTLPGSTATGSSGKPRLTNLMQLTLDTSWWTRYRSRANNPDLDPNFVFPQAVPDLHNGQFTAIPRTDADLHPPKHIQAIANTAAFHFPTIEQGGNSLYPAINAPPFDTQNFQTNLIMPEPCPFLSRTLPRCSIIRPTKTNGIAMGVVKFLTDMGLFIGQSPAFFAFLHQLAQEADAARRGA